LRKFAMTMAVAMLLSVGVWGAGPVQAEESVVTDSSGVKKQLTEQQKSEIAALYKDIFAKRKEIVNKYKEYGVITEEKANKMISRLDKYQEKLEKNGYIPHWDKHKKKHSH